MGFKTKKKRSVFSSNSIISFLFSFYRSAVFVNSSVFVKKRDNKKKKKQHTAESFFFFFFFHEHDPYAQLALQRSWKKACFFFFLLSAPGLCRLQLSLIRSQLHVRIQKVEITMCVCSFLLLFLFCFFF